MNEIMNQGFKTVFCVEEAFTEPRGDVGVSGLKEVQVERKEIKIILEKLDIKKAMGLDGVLNWTLKECSKELVESVWDVINTSFMEGIVPKKWKGANIVLIYKEKKRQSLSTIGQCH